MCYLPTLMPLFSRSQSLSAGGHSPPRAFWDWVWVDSGVVDLNIAGCLFLMWFVFFSRQPWRQGSQPVRWKSCWNCPPLRKSKTSWRDPPRKHWTIGSVSPPPLPVPSQPTPPHRWFRWLLMTIAAISVGVDISISTFTSFAISPCLCTLYLRPLVFLWLCVMWMERRRCSLALTGLSLLPTA